MNKRTWCAYGGEAYSSPRKELRYVHADGSGRLVYCPGCGRPVKLRKHPSSGGVYMQIPRHYKQEETR